MYLLCKYRGALRAPLYVHDEIHTAEAAAKAAAAHPAAPAAASVAAPAAAPAAAASVLIETASRRPPHPWRTTNRHSEIETLRLELFISNLIETWIQI